MFTICNYPDADNQPKPRCVFKNFESASAYLYEYLLRTEQDAQEWLIHCDITDKYCRAEYLFWHWNDDILAIKAFWSDRETLLEPLSSDPVLFLLPKPPPPPLLTERQRHYPIRHLRLRGNDITIQHQAVMINNACKFWQTWQDYSTQDVYTFAGKKGQIWWRDNFKHISKFVSNYHTLTYELTLMPDTTQ